MRADEPAERGTDMKERLQKILSSCGVCSRRTAEEYLRQGRVAVNGIEAKLGEQADLAVDTITLDGNVISAGDRRTYLMLNKPRGYVTTLSDEKGRKTVAELVDCGIRVWPVGRLDMDSEGLLLLTNDGELTNRLIHPKHEVEKEYLVWVTGDLSAETLERLRRPMVLDGQRLRPATVERKGEKLLSITIHEGKYRQVRRMCGAVGLHVTRLKRIREGKLMLGDLSPGRWRELTEDELALLNG